MEGGLERAVPTGDIALAHALEADRAQGARWWTRTEIGYKRCGAKDRTGGLVPRWKDDCIQWRCQPEFIVA